MVDPATAPRAALKAPGNLLGRAAHNKPVVIAVAVGGGVVLAIYIHRSHKAQDAIDQPQDTPTLDSANDYYDPGQGYGGSAGNGGYFGGDYPQQPIDNTVPLNGYTLVPDGGRNPDLTAALLDSGIMPLPTPPAPTGGGLPPSGTQPHESPAAPKPALGPGIFYNDARKLRYIVKRQDSPSRKGYECNYRRYESRLNKGDWGQGGVVLIDGSCKKKGK